MPTWLQEMGGGHIHHNKIEETMNKDQLVQSLGKEITPEEVAEVLRAYGYEVQQVQEQAPPAASVNAEELQRIITEASTASFKPLQEKIAELEQQLTALGGKPGAPPAMPKAAADPADDTLTDEEKQKRKRIQEINQKLLAGFREGKSIRLS